MKTIKDGGPAFPNAFTDNHQVKDGMTLRDYFAAHAPVTFEAAAKAFGGVPDNDDQSRSTFFTVWALLRYEYADAMLEQRKEPRRGE